MTIQYLNDYDHRDGINIRYVHSEHPVNATVSKSNPRKTNRQGGTAYIYTDFEPFFAHKMFPCFDQPDIKASLRLITLTTSNWRVVANEREETFYLIGSGTAAQAMAFYGLSELVLSYFDPAAHIILRVFPPSPPLPSYLYVLCAGPYECYEDPSHIHPPIRVFIQEQKKSILQTYGWTIANWIANSVSYFERYLDYPYPFRKLDLLLIPEYNDAGMENAGCIVICESMLKVASIEDEEKREDAQETLFHEISHHWFGNLVTMKWWNELWLKESLAEFFGVNCLQTLSPDPLSLLRIANFFSIYSSALACCLEYNRLLR